ncbi:acyltransferase [Ruminococcus sp.]|jgi:surface polysaccharide O-acyltransferase-like enzyme|uniref:acyltransferase n=1 Tax=Ruminococcus sp. TaxID=41978 RepID=UPI0025CE858F|nr:acyltransferase [Ruminococcus sp.]
METKRYYNLDLMKCIAISFVVCSHSFYADRDIINSKSILANVNYCFNGLLSVCVPIFFFVNGYLLFSKSFNLKKHVSKCVKLVVMTVFWCPVLFFLYEWIKDETFEWGRLVSSVLNMDKELKFFWFMGELFCIYIWFPALKALFDTNIKAFIYFTAISAFFAFGLNFISHILEYFYMAFDKEPILVTFPLLDMFITSNYAIVYFCLGGLAYMYKDKITAFPAKKRYMICCIGIVISALVLYSYAYFKSVTLDGHLWNNVSGGYSSIPVLCSTVFWYGLCIDYQKNSKIVVLVSKNTLGIYILHYLPIILSNKLLLSRKYMNNLLLIALHVVLVIAVCLGMIWILKKIPLIKKMI